MVQLSLTRPRRKWLRSSSGVLAALAAAASLGCHRSSSGEAAGQRPPAPVVVAPAEVRAVPTEITAIGTVTPINTIAVRSRVDGTLERIYFEQGHEVSAGQPLFLIDPRPFQLALELATANLARDQAQLANAVAEERRYATLLPKNIVSRQDYDLRVAQARTLRATVAADRAAMNAARVNLGYTLITSPITGRTGSLQIDLGNLIKAQDATPMVIIRQMRSIYVAFSVPATFLPQIRQGQSKAPLQVIALVAGRPPEEGKLTFIDNTVDPTTGTILLKGTFPNAQEYLWPGEFANVRLIVGIQPNAVLVPARSVQPGQQGEHVFIVGPNNAAEMRRVQAGERVGNWVVVTGVRPGERVVTDGLLGLVPGAHVRIEGPGPGQGQPQDSVPRPAAQGQAQVQGRRP